MKRNLVMYITTPTLLVALAVPVQLSAQDNKVHHYHLADIGTFGGPNVGLAVQPIAQIVNNRGAVVGTADTPTLNPYYPNGNPFVGGGQYVGNAFSWQHGVLTNLGGLPGGLNSGADWISNAGLVAGISENGEIDPLLGFPEAIAVLWKDGKVISLGTLDGGYESVANAVNDRGQVVGPALNTIPDPYSMLGLGTQTRAFLWENGVMRDLGTLGGPDAFAIYVNDRGQIAGTSYVNSTANSGDPCGYIPTQDPFLWEGGKMIDLGTLGGVCGFANGLNNRGEVVGQSDLSGDLYFHPFLWTKSGGMRDLGTLGGNLGTATWLNDAGVVVGVATVPGDQVAHAFRWKEGVMTDLGEIEGFPCSNANAINSSGQIVGAAYSDCAVGHAFLWQDGHAIDLNFFVPPDSGVLLEEADFINDRGEILGLAALANGNEHAFLLIPCDENHPDIEGCDYSLVDASAAVPQTTPAVRNASGRTLPPSLARRMNRHHLSGPAFSPRS